MTEDQLREFVRLIVEERLSGRTPAAEVSSAAVQGPPMPARAAGPAAHPSHLRLHVLPGAEAGGPCLIEPAVRCNLCGYCQSLGH